MIVLADRELDRTGLGAVLKTALDCVVVMRVDGTVVGWNDLAESTFGWSFAEANGRRMSELIIPLRYREAHETGLARYLATGEGPVLDRHFEIEAICRDGREVPVELSITRTAQFGEPVFLGFLRDITERRDAARRQELLIGELNHRVRNMLGVISSIAHQSARDAADVGEFSRSFGGRLEALGRAHDVLTESVWEPAPLSSLTGTMLAPYVSENRVTTAGDETTLESRQLRAMSMIIHELTTNAVKYGALSERDGTIALEWRSEGGRVTFSWIERGVKGVRPPSRKGFGSKLIDLCVAHDLGGTVTRDWSVEGVRCRIDFPAGRKP